MLLQELTEAPAGVDALAAGKSHVGQSLVDLQHILNVQGVAGLLVVVDVQRLQALTQLNAGVHIGIGMGLDNDVHVGAAGLAHGLGALVAGLQHLLAELATHFPVAHRLTGPDALIGNAHGVDLDGIVAVLNGVLGGLCVVSGVGEEQMVGAPAELQLAGIGADAVVGLAAQQLVDRHVVGLADNVPQSGIDGAHTGVDDGAAAHAPEGGAEDALPDLLRLQGIHADDVLAVVPGDAHSRIVGGTVGQTDLTVAIDVLVVGVDPHADDLTHDVGLAFNNINTCNFHTEYTLLINL